MRRMRWLLALAAVPAVAFPLSAQLVPLPPPHPVPAQVNTLIPVDAARAPARSSPSLYTTYSATPFSGYSSVPSTDPFGAYHALWGVHRRRAYAALVGSPRIVVAQPIVIVAANGPPPGSLADALLPQQRQPAGDEVAPNPANQQPQAALPQRPPPEPLHAPAKDVPAKPAPPSPETLPAPVQARAPVLPPPVQSAEKTRNHDPVQIQLGKQAFAAREYGRALRHFEQAVLDAPEARSHFLLAQALFARGRYGDAVDEIETGLRLRPDWPSSRFPIRALYGPNLGDFAEQFQHLEELVAQNPRDPVLLFLYGYELWFDGRGAEAELWFQRAMGLGANRALVEPFLTTAPPSPK